MTWQVSHESQELLSALDVHPFMVGSVLLISGTAGTLRAPWMYTRLWWGPCCSSQELLASYECLGCTPVYGGVRVAHLRSCWHAMSALDAHPFMVGSVLRISGAAGTLRAPWMHTRLWWGPCCYLVLCVVFLFCFSSSCVLCAQWCQFLLGCPFLIVPSLFSNVWYTKCILLCVAVYKYTKLLIILFIY